MEQIKNIKLNKIMPQKTKGKVDSFDERIKRVVKQLKLHMEKEILKEEDFNIIRQSASAVNSKDVLQELVFEISMEKSLFHLKLTGEGLMGQEENLIIKSGTKQEILDRLNEEDFLKQIFETTQKFRTGFQS